LSEIGVPKYIKNIIIDIREITDAGSTGRSLIAAATPIAGCVCHGLMISPYGPWVFTQVDTEAAVTAVQQAVV
jgi:hypothetical protein